MIVYKKKNVLQELAVSLFLMLQFDKDTAALSLIRRIRERADAALQAAAVYTGVIAEKDIQEFLNSRHLRFIIDCGSDIVKGDIIRFVEAVFDNRRKPPRQLGKRSITAEVLDIRPADDNPMLRMRVIASGGVWELKLQTEIRRTLKNIIQFEVKRVPWDNEKKREEATTQATEIQISGRYDCLKSQ